MLSRKSLAAMASTIGLGFAVVATVALAADDGEGAAVKPRALSAEIEPLERDDRGLERAIEEHRIEKLTARYRDLYEDAEKLGVEPARNLVAGRSEPGLKRLSRGVRDIREDVAKARKKSGGGSGDFALAGGVSQATLDSIASCESGGDPRAVNAAGYYGKYQFDPGTWASVGGSGNPAEASEAEQDMRASMLYARAGSSPWPVCGS